MNSHLTNKKLAALVAVLTLAPVLAQRQPPAPQGPWMNKSLTPDQRADLVLEQMTLDEKMMLVHGAGSFAAAARSNGGAGVVAGIPRLGLPDLQLADSAVGVRAAAERGRYATLLPSADAEAATWDLKLAWAYGDVIGRELRDQQYNVSLGGGCDITREPRNGRNFEYQGEDPILAGKMVAQFVKGLQSNHVIGDVKHYAFNDQETGRNIGNVLLGKREARETDLLTYEPIRQIDVSSSFLKNRIMSLPPHVRHFLRAKYHPHTLSFKSVCGGGLLGRKWQRGGVT